MKRTVCLILIFSILLSGCTIFGERIKDPVTFYYVRNNYQRDMSQVIGSEIREASGHRNDLSYLLALYMMGPSTESLRSPLPHGTKVTPLEYNDERILLEFSENALKITDAEYTLASACIAMTCINLTDASEITVICRDRSITLKKDTLLVNEPNEE